MAPAQAQFALAATATQRAVNGFPTGAASAVKTPTQLKLDGSKSLTPEGVGIMEGEVQEGKYAARVITVSVFVDTCVHTYADFARHARRRQAWHAHTSIHPHTQYALLVIAGLVLVTMFARQWMNAETKLRKIRSVTSSNF
jgi:hypothetical protein